MEKFNSEIISSSDHVKSIALKVVMSELFTL